MRWSSLAVLLWTSVSLAQSPRMLLPEGEKPQAVELAKADIQAVITDFDAASLTWPWRHTDPRVDALQQSVMRSVMEKSKAARAVPHMTEAWYCCAEPSAEDMRLI